MIIEEITEEVQSSSSKDQGSPSECSALQPQETNGGVPLTNSESLQTLKDDPESIRFVTLTMKFSKSFLFQAVNMSTTLLKASCFILTLFPSYFLFPLLSQHFSSHRMDIVD